MYFEIVGDIERAETFAIGSAIREIARLRRLYGRGRWRKRKGIVRVKLEDDTIRVAEVHSCHGADAESSRSNVTSTDANAYDRKTVCRLPQE